MDASSKASASVVKKKKKMVISDCSDCLLEWFRTGLISVAESVGLKLLPPRKKITVFLMGNHSAGKSSFINW